MTSIKEDIKARETIIWTTQIVYAMKDQGHNILAHETIFDTKVFEEFMPKGTKRIAVIYFD